MKFLSPFFLLLLCIGLLMTACEKENFDEIVPTGEPVFQPDSVAVNSLLKVAKSGNTAEGVELACITINFPFELLLDSGVTITINSQAEFEAAIFAEGPNQVVDFVFPLTITDDAGEVLLIEDNLALGNAFISCIPQEGWEESSASDATIPVFLFDDTCFDIIYPVDVEDDAGNTYLVTNEAELIDLSAENEVLFFSLPLTVIDKDSMELTIETVSMFFDLVFTCDGVSPPVVGENFVITGFGCNKLLYPATLLTSEGELITVNNEDEYVNLILSGVSVELQFPFSLLNLITGETMTINDELDLIAALQACGVDIEIGETETCDTPDHVLLFFNQGSPILDCRYSINFPLQLEAGGETYTITSFTQYFDEVYNTFAWDEVELIYPVSVTLLDETTLTFESAEDLCAFLDGCAE